MNYYERHLGDYARDTGHLSLLEHGVYGLLLDRYYATEEPIPADQVYRLARCRTDDERAAVDAVLGEFFVLDGDAWRNTRCDSEIGKYQEKRDKAKASANARWADKPSDSERNANAMRTQCERNAHQSPVTSNQKDQKQKQPRVAAQPPPDDVDPQTWADWLALRKAKRAPVTETVIREARREAAKAGMAFGQFLAVWCRRGSQGLEADWLKPHERPQSPRAGPDQPMGKQMQGIAALEKLKDAARQRMATAGSGNGAPEALLPLAGSDARR